MSKYLNKDISDFDLVESIVVHKRKEYFDLLYDRYSNLVYNKCLQFEPDQNQAQDLAQDVFIKVFLNLSKYRGQSKLSSWIYVIAYNYCVDHARKQKLAQQKKIQGLDRLEDDVDEPSDEDISSTKLDILQTVLKQIDPDEKMMLIMKYQDGMKILEMAEILNSTEGAIKMKLKRIKQKVKILIEEKQKLAISK